jgi:CRP/FNR family transcriptional regulator, dissimilatory nitrate respiration regulator
MEERDRETHRQEILSRSDISVLAGTTLFRGISEEETEFLVKCLRARRHPFPKGSFIQHAGEPFTRIGIVLSGSVDILFEDAVGRKSILTTIEPGGMFGEGAVTARLPASPVSVYASTDVSACFLEYPFMVRSCEKNCSYHSLLVENMIEILSRKLLLMNKKLNYALTRSIRDKITSYLVDEYGAQKTRRFEIVYNREELANYLSVDRSSLSRELAKMKEEGLINFRKNRFELRELFFDVV